MTITDDIMKAAREAAHAVPICDLGSTEGITVIANAIAAERERCARVAWSHIGEMPDDDAPLDIYDETRIATASAITDAIRNGDQP